MSGPDLSRWRAIKNEIQAKFPDVRHVGSDAARDLAGNSSVLVLDVRAASEFAVSHLPGAVSAPDVLAAIAGQPKDRAILIYCSVGYRSAAAAERLAKAGYRNVTNYLGSIFEWANQGLPLSRGAGPATQVHPYNRDWGQLLRAELRASESLR